MTISPSNLKRPVSPPRGPSNLDASLKSMVTVQSEPDHNKFLRTGIYKHANQPLGGSKESVTHNQEVTVVSTVNADGDDNKRASELQAER